MKIYVLSCFFMVSSFYRRFSLSSVYYNVVLFVVLLQCFVCVRVIHT